MIGDARPEVIACDESGSEGENIVRAAHRIFVHGSVRLETAEAQDLLAEVRRRAPSQAPEYKAEQILRPEAAETLEWLLRGDGLRGRARMYLVDKEYFAVGKVIDLLIEELTHSAGIDLYSYGTARDMAWALHRQGPRALGADWRPLLLAFNSLMRISQRKGAKTTVDEFYAEVDRVRLKSRRRVVSEVLALVWAARLHAQEFQRELVGSARMPPALDPLFAAIPQTARSWHGQLKCSIQLVHDVQSSLTPPRVEAMLAALRRPTPEFARFAAGIPVLGLEQVDSRSDPRVQVADLVAGVARVVAENVLLGKPETRAELLQPFVDLHSLWSDDLSWSALTGRDNVGLEPLPPSEPPMNAQ